MKKKTHTTARKAEAPSAPAVSNIRLFVLVFITGASVLIVEILGTRVIGPVFGVSLFVWSSLLAVTLGALAVGYYVGGVLVDSSPTSRLLDLAVVVSAALLAIAPAVRYWVLAATQSLGPRVGPLASALVLFAPALVTLGTTGPMAVRLASHDVRSTGHRVGSLFAVSTAGSVVGALLAGFWLIPTFESDQILLGVASLLAVVGGVPLVVRRDLAALASCIPILAGLVPTPSMPSGFTQIARAQSLYGLVEVIDDQEKQLRFMRVDHSVIGADRLPAHEPAFKFVHMIALARVLRPDARSMLQLGLGTGSLIRQFAPYGIETDAVEIDPVVVRFAREHFLLQADTANVFVDDARAFLNRTQQQYDIVVHDTFTGGATPEHLLSREVVERVRHVLRPRGLLVLNFVGSVSGDGALASQCVARTLRAVFKGVRAFRDSPRPGISNIVFFASDAPLGLDELSAIHLNDSGLEAARDLIARYEVLADASLGEVITDARNPLALLELPIAEEHAAAMNKLLPLEVWLH